MRTANEAALQTIADHLGATGSSDRDVQGTTVILYLRPLPGASGTEAQGRRCTVTLGPVLIDCVNALLRLVGSEAVSDENDRMKDSSDRGNVSSDHGEGLKSPVQGFDEFIMSSEELCTHEARTKFCESRERVFIAEAANTAAGEELVRAHRLGSISWAPGAWRSPCVRAKLIDELSSTLQVVRNSGKVGLRGLRLRFGQSRSGAECDGSIGLGQNDTTESWRRTLESATANRTRIDAIPGMIALASASLGGCAVATESVADLGLWMTALRRLRARPMPKGEGAYIRPDGRRLSSGPPQSLYSHVHFVDSEVEYIPSPRQVEPATPAGQPYYGIVLRLSQRLGLLDGIRLQLDGTISAPLTSTRADLLKFLSEWGDEARLRAATHSAACDAADAAQSEAAAALGLRSLERDSAVPPATACTTALALQSLSPAVAGCLVGTSVHITPLMPGAFSVSAADATIRVSCHGPWATESRNG